MDKKITKELELINLLCKSRNELESKDSYNYLFYKEGKGFIIETNKLVNMTPSKFRFENLDDTNYQIVDIDIKIISSQIKSSDGINNSIFSVRKFSSNNFNKEEQSKYKLIIPYYEKIEIAYQDFFSPMNFMIHINGIFFSGIELTIKGYTFQVFHIDDLFIVESLDDIEFNKFDKYCRVTLASFGFITGFVPMGEGFYFEYHNEQQTQFLFDSSFYNTYKTQYNLITTNAYEYYQNIDLNFDFTKNIFKNDARIESVNQEIKPIERNIFEKLINEMIENIKFSEAVFSILSINNLKSFSIFLKAGLYTIVLEMITSIINNSNKLNQEEVMKEEYKKLRMELQKKLHETAKEVFKKNNLKYENSIVNKRLNGIYNPINSDKLTEAYEILQIPLTDQDRKNIRLRNKFLHGSGCIPIM